MKPTKLWDEKEMDRAIHRIAKDILADGTDNVSLVGIRSRGVPLAEWIAEKLGKIKGRPVEVGVLDINLYRDDLTEVSHQPVVRPTELPFPVDGRGIILVDDVLYTGRTIRAAMDALVDYGRPRFIKLVALVDRGWREFPIQADYVGTTLNTTATQNVKVMIKPIDAENQVLIRDSAA
jgi:pyrimidine operon attenuation protein/uracil phosphoribosyltransferase